MSLAFLPHFPLGNAMQLVVNERRQLVVRRQIAIVPTQQQFSDDVIISVVDCTIHSFSVLDWVNSSD